MRAQTKILFFRWVTLTEQRWAIFRERRSVGGCVANWARVDHSSSDDLISEFTVGVPEQP